MPPAPHPEPLGADLGPPPALSPLPQDSYMLPFFSDMAQYLQVGLPTYFVTTAGYDFTTPEGTNAICSSAGCDNDSLTQTIQYATQFPNV